MVFDIADIAQTKIKTSDVRLVKELYPRLTEDNAAIERYRAAIGLLPSIAIARDGILVDGYHRWQAHIKEGITEIDADNLGDLSDIEILKESMLRNAHHGLQLSAQDKKRDAAKLYAMLEGTPAERYAEISTLLSITLGTAQKYCADARQNELKQQKDTSWDRWLDCYTQQEIADEIGVSREAISDWVGNFRTNSKYTMPPESRQHFDVWNFSKADSDSAYFGRMPPQVVENLLWFYTEPGQIVFDPFAGGGTTITISKAMGRRVWSSDIKPSTPMLPIHEHNILEGWPTDAPKQADFILLDPPYWQQAEGKYSNNPQDLGNMSLEDFYTSWANIIKVCASHVAPKGHVAYIISPSFNSDGSVVDHAIDMLPACWNAGLTHERIIIVPYSTQQANGAQVEWAREKNFMLVRNRYLVVLRKRDG